MQRYLGCSNHERSFEILFGVGLGPLRFRMTETDAEDILGPPEEAVEFDSDNHLYYPSLGIFLFFGADQAGSLSGIEVNADCSCTLAGETLFPRQRDQTIHLLRLILGPSGGDDAFVIYLEDEGQTRFKSESLAADFYFSREGFLVSLNWSEMG